MCTKLFEVQEFFVRIITMKHYFHEQEMMLMKVSPHTRDFSHELGDTI